MSHLTVEQRYTIECMLKQGRNKSEISVMLEVSQSTVTREIQRNRDGRDRTYKYKLAQRKSEERKKCKPKEARFTSSIKARAEELIRQEYSPEQIVGRCKRDGEEMVSHERLYQHIWADKKAGGDLHSHLRHQGRRYRKRGALKDSRGIIANRVGIDKRPEEVEKRQHFGDLEGDTIIGKNHQGAIITINDRSTGMLKMKKVKAREAVQVEGAIIDLMKEWSTFGIRTMTVDNGKEFANHQGISEKTGVDIYFAKPYHSWQRGSNENLNGLVRQYIPKKTDFSQITDEEIEYIENKINNRPRKRYDYDSPIERMEKLLFNEKIAFVT